MAITDIIFKRIKLAIDTIEANVEHLQDDVATIVAKSDVVDVVACYDNDGDTSKTDLVHYNTANLGDNDIIKVLDDETHGNAESYYRFSKANNTFTCIGSLSSSYTKTQTDALLSTKLNKNQGVENAGKVLVVDNDGEIVPSAEQSGGKSKWHLVLDEIMKKEDAFDRYRMRLGLIKKSVGGLVDITDCAQLKAHIKNLVLGDDMDNIAEANRTIIYDDKVWQQAAVKHIVNNPYGQFGKIRWSDKPLFGWRQTEDPTGREVTIDGNGFRLPLEYNLNPQPGEAQVQVDQSFVISEDGKMAFRIEADGIKQRAIIQQAPHIPIASVPSETIGANAALQFTLNNQQIFGPLFDGPNLNYYTGAYNYTNLTCPQVAELPASAQEGDYCYNTTDGKYYVYSIDTSGEEPVGVWLDISTQTNTPHINFVAELPEVDVANVGELYVLNSDVGFVNSIQTLQYSYSASSVANSAINSLKYGNWYNVACPESTTPPENPATTPFYFEPNGQKYYAYKVVEQNGEQVGIWADITASITQGTSLPSSYNDGNFFVFTGTFGQANSLYVAVIEEFDSNNQALYTVGGSLDIHLLLQPDNAGYVDVSNVKVLATYNSSNSQWTIKVVTITGNNLIGTYIGTEAGAQSYIKDIIATVAKTALGEIYTFVQRDGATAIYDEQGTWKVGNNGTISDSGQFLSWGGDKNYTRDTTHDTTAENWLRLANTVNIYFTGDSSKNGKVSAQQVPNAEGGKVRIVSENKTAGALTVSDQSGNLYDSGDGGGAGYWSYLSMDNSKSNASYVNNGKVQQSAVGYSLYVVVKDHDEVALRKQFANYVNPNASNVAIGSYEMNTNETDYSADIEVFVRGSQVGSYTTTATATYAANYMLCDGRAISRSTYSELFAKLGTTFGSGDGSTTFNLPDFRDKTMWGANGNLNSTLAAGLPNITGAISGIGGGGYGASGVFTSSASSSQGWGDSKGNNKFNFNLNASRSSSIYGNSTTVQPPAICVNVFICVSQVPAENSGS